MDNFMILIGLSITMFIGSYLSGIAPLSISLSDTKLRLVTIFGAGLLVGTALAVIVPEGVQALYESEIKEYQLLMDTHMKGLASSDVSPIEAGKDSDKILGLNNENVDHKPARMKRENHEDGHQHRPATKLDSWIGCALVLGFLFMLIVDQVAKGSTTSGGGQSRYKFTATLGLVVHSAADGIAMGAAACTSQSDIQIIVFLAVMLHKAPAAFGLSVFLMFEGVDKIRIRRHLLIFALAAPLAAILTYFIVVSSGNETLSSMHTTGVLMLFSAGTFLYVATVHVLPELVSENSASLAHSYLPVSKDEASSDGNAAQVSFGHSHAQGGGFKFNELLALVAGTILPMFLSIGHTH